MVGRVLNFHGRENIPPGGVVLLRSEIWESVAKPSRRKVENHDVENTCSYSSKNDVSKSVQEELRSVVEQIDPSLNVAEEVVIDNVGGSLVSYLPDGQTAFHCNQEWANASICNIRCRKLRWKTIWIVNVDQGTLEKKFVCPLNLLIVLRLRRLCQVFPYRATKTPRKEDESLRCTVFSPVKHNDM